MESVDEGNDARKIRNSEFKKYLRPVVRTESNVFAFSDSDRATKRVIAPYVNMVRKGHKVTLRRAAKKFSFFLTKKPSVLMKNLSEFLADSSDLPTLLYETTEVLKGIIEATGSRLYMVNASSGEIYQFPKNVNNPRLKVTHKIGDKKSVAAYVAAKKEYVLSEDILIDPRFPDAISYKDIAKSVLSVPIVTKNDICYAILEFYRDMNLESFSKDNLKIVVLIASWIGATIHQNQEGVVLHMKQDINDYLLELVRAYFGNALTLEKMICEVVGYAKLKLKAEKGAFYIIEKDKDEFVADVYEEGIAVGEAILVKKNQRVRFGKDKTVATLVARTCELQNVKDLYNDPRFNKETENSIISRTQLCMPIVGHEGILGIVTVINKTDGRAFNETDEELISVVAIYCAMALHFARLKAENKRCDYKIETMSNLLKHHTKPCIHSTERFDARDRFEMPKNIFSFEYYIGNDEVSMMPQIILQMYIDVIGGEFINIQDMKSFILSVQKSYKDTPYHNFKHAFNVTHCMFAILRENKSMFSQIEVQSLMISALGHDLDHEGFNNNYLALTNHVLFNLYPDSTLENHHYDVTMMLLSNGNVFNNVTTPEIYDTFRTGVKEAILATDLSSYFKCRAKIVPLINEEVFNWDIPLHRTLGKTIIITTCDLSGMCKPFCVAKNITDALYKEFYRQGDTEKSLGLMPLIMMDRESQHQVPDDQAQFLSVIVIPLCELLKVIIPNTHLLLHYAQLLRDTWKQIIESRGLKLWRQDDSVVF